MHMLLPSICRTCDIKRTRSLKLHELSSRADKHERTLSELLSELTKIDLNIESHKKLPQHLCSFCANKIENAYEFVIQAKEANELLLACLNEESPIEVQPSKDLPEKVASIQQTDSAEEEFCEVKFEVETSAVEMVQDAQLESSDDDAAYDATIDPLVTGCSVNVKCEAAQNCSASDNEYDELPLAQRQSSIKRAATQHPKTKKINQTKPMDKSNTYKCSKCDKSYLRPKNLQAHIRTHSEENAPMRTTNLCERRKVKDFDINLCKPNGCKLIQCMICLRKCTKFAELRNHLREHCTNPISFEQRTESLYEIAKSFYTRVKQSTQASQLVARIKMDLAENALARFYSITNEVGYELSLDSSETDSDNELDTEAAACQETKHFKRKYCCELCKLSFLRKYQLLEHQMQQHKWLEARHVCGRCDARFVSEQLLLHHNKSLCKNTKKRLLCNKCPQRFRWKHNYRAHIKTHREKGETFPCTSCERVYDDKKSLTIHMLSFHADASKLMPCHWCNRKFYRRDYLLKHLKRHGLAEGDLPLAETLIAANSKANGAKTIYCKICNKQFERIAELRQHILMELKLPSSSTHNNYESFTNYSILNESGYELYLDDSETDEEHSAERLTGGQPTTTAYSCELCQIVCRRKYELMQHQRAMHSFETLPYACEKCIFRSVSKQLLLYHKLTQCLNVDKKLNCDKCSYLFMWPENLALHKRLQHGEEHELQTNQMEDETKIPNYTKEILPEQTTKKLLQCPHCDRTYLLQSFLNNHIRDVHIDDNRKRKQKEAERKFLCSLCGIETHTSSNLVIHMRRHTGEKPFKCNECNMGFIRRTELIIHQRRHTGERPFHCTVCGKDFARSDKLKRHMLTHSGLKPHKCTFCEKAYRYTKDLKLHLIQHTGETPFECGTCNERFLQNTALEKHRIMRGHFEETK